MQTRKRKYTVTNAVLKKQKQPDIISGLHDEIKIHIFDYVPPEEYMALRYVCRWTRRLIEVEKTMRENIFHIHKNKGFRSILGVFGHYLQYKSETLWKSILDNPKRYLSSTLENEEILLAIQKGCISNVELLNQARSMLSNCDAENEFLCMWSSGALGILDVVVNLPISNKRVIDTPFMYVFFATVCEGKNAEFVLAWLDKYNETNKYNETILFNITFLMVAIMSHNIEVIVTVYNYISRFIKEMSYQEKREIYLRAMDSSNLDIVKLVYYMIMNVTNKFKNLANINIGSRTEKMKDAKGPIKNLFYGTTEHGINIKDEYITLNNYKSILQALPNTAFEMDTFNGHIRREFDIVHNMNYCNLMTTHTFVYGHLTKEIVLFMFDAPTLDHEFTLDDTGMGSIFNNPQYAEKLLNRNQEKLFMFLWEKKLLYSIHVSYIDIILSNDRVDILDSLNENHEKLLVCFQSYVTNTTDNLRVISRKVIHWLTSNGFTKFVEWWYEIAIVNFHKKGIYFFCGIVDIIQYIHEHGKSLGLKCGTLRYEFHLYSISHDYPKLYNLLELHNIKLEDATLCIPYKDHIFPFKWSTNIYRKHGEKEFLRKMRLFKFKGKILKDLTKIIKEFAHYLDTLEKYDIKISEICVYFPKVNTGGLFKN